MAACSHTDANVSLHSRCEACAYPLRPPAPMYKANEEGLSLNGRCFTALQIKEAFDVQVRVAAVALKRTKSAFLIMRNGMKVHPRVFEVYEIPLA